MGREIKRVALDFDWPIGKIWTGYKLCLCSVVGEDCDTCRAFAKQAKLEMTSYNCPNIPQLEPPSGDGYQLWETVSEGSPMTPVFAAPEELAQWCVDNTVSTFGYQTTSYENWLKFITKSGHAFTMIVSNDEIKSGVDHIAEHNEPTP